MQRRKFLIGMGSLAAGSAAAIGTGAVDTMQADRRIEVETAGDKNAYLGLIANTNSQFVSNSGDKLSIDFASDSEHGGTGVNVGRTTVRPAFTVANQGSQDIFVEINNPFSNPDISTKKENNRDPSGVPITVPKGLDVQFIAVPQGTANNISVGEAYYIDRNQDVSFGPNFQSNTDPAYVRYKPGSETSRNPVPGYLGLGPGERADVILQVVATQDVNLNLGSADPLFTVLASSDETYMSISSEASNV